MNQHFANLILSSIIASASNLSFAQVNPGSPLPIVNKSKSAESASMPRPLNLDELVGQIPQPLLAGQKEIAADQEELDSMRRQIEKYNVSRALLNAKEAYLESIGQTNQPTVVSVFIFQGKRIATLFQKDIGNFQAEEGAMLIGGYQVASISDSGSVILQKDGVKLVAKNQFGDFGVAKKSASRTSGASAPVPSAGARASASIPMPPKKGAIASGIAALTPPSQ